MILLNSEDELTDWDGYREFMKLNLKLIKAGGPCYVSKDKLEFDLDGKPWMGYAFLAGKNAPMCVNRLKKDGILFREGVCSSDGKDLSVSGFPSPLHVKAIAKTLLKLKLGYKVAGFSDEGEPTDAGLAGDAGEAGHPKAEHAGTAAGAARQKKVDELKKLTSDLGRLLAVLKK